MAQNESGKRYVCAVCRSEVIVTRASKEQKAPLTCHDQPMQPKQQGYAGPALHPFL